MRDQPHKVAETPSNRLSIPKRYTFKVSRGNVPPIPGRESVDFDDFIDEAMQEWAAREERVRLADEPEEN